MQVRDSHAWHRIQELRSWVSDSPQEVITYLMGACKWSGMGMRRAWEELSAELQRLDDEYWDNVDDEARKRFHTARRIWPIRDETAPSVEEGETPMTWGEWFEQVFGEPLDGYAERAKRMKIRERVRDYELRRFGRSELSETNARPQDSSANKLYPPRPGQDKSGGGEGAGKARSRTVEATAE